jgi:signal transduction histidine kinase
VGNYLEVLRRRGADAELIEAIEREAARIDAIVRSLLSYATPREAARETLDLPTVVDGAVDLLRAQGLLKQVHVHIAMAGAVPQVLADRTALEQVFVNLLLNAVDAVGDGGRIAVTTGPTVLGEAPEAPRRADDPADSTAAAARRERRLGRHLPGLPDGSPAALVVVADSGPGVPPELSERIFDPFVTTKPPGKGTGLGLAIVQRTVHDHGGRVDVARAREGGAAFIVTLPAAPRA